jgi:hypothetical protein
MKTISQSKARKIRQGMLRRRRLTLFKKLNEYYKLSGAEVYTLLYVNGRFYEYSTTCRPSWPPSRDQIVSLLFYSCLNSNITLTKQTQHYPLPVRLEPTLIDKDMTKVDESEDCV